MSNNLIAWEPEPEFRGTLNIFISCVTTLSLCLWSALHTDIQTGRSTWTRGLTKAGWLVVGLLCPELLLFNAWHQLREAIRLTQSARRMLDGENNTCQPEKRSWLIRVLECLIGEQGNNDTEAFRHVNRKYSWTLTHSFYAVMGGFVLHDPYPTKSNKFAAEPYLPPWQLHGVLTPDGVRFLMEHEPSSIPDLAVDDIRDRSKASLFTKALLVCQVLWFLVACINRGVQGLPLSLLEISTIAHALCSLLTYAVWWRKPKDVSHQTVIALPNDGQIGAWMSMASSASQYLLGGILKISNRSEMEHVDIVQIVQPSRSSHDDEPKARRPGPRNKSIQPPDNPHFSFRPAGNLQKRPQRDCLWNLVNTWRMSLIFGATATVPWYVHWMPTHKAEGDRTAVPGDVRGGESIPEKGKDDPETVDSSRDISIPGPSEFTPMDLRRWALAYEAQRRYSLSAHISRVRYVVPIASLQAFTDTHQYTFGGICRTALLAAALGAVYGLPHLIALTVTFPTAIEGTLWRVATVVVAALGLTLGTITVVLFGIAELFDRSIKCVTGNRQPTSDKIDRLLKRARMLFERAVVVLGAIVYVSSSAYLVAETIRQLFALPPEVFVLPSWANYWPHFA